MVSPASRSGAQVYEVDEVDTPHFDPFSPPARERQLPAPAISDPNGAGRLPRHSSIGGTSSARRQDPRSAEPRHKAAHIRRASRRTAPRPETASAFEIPPARD